MWQRDDALGQAGRTAGGPVAIFVATMAMAPAVMADNFSDVHYDPDHNQLIVTMRYDGTNAHHQFSVVWGDCLKLDEPGAPSHQIDVDILDNQGNDVAQDPYTKVVKVPLANVGCRPARVTLATSPSAAWNKRTLDIP